MTSSRPAIVLSCAACLALAITPLRFDVSTRALEAAGAIAAPAKSAAPAKPAAAKSATAKPAAKAKKKSAKAKAKGKKSRKVAKSRSRGKGKAVVAAPLSLDAAQVEASMVKNAGDKSAIELLASYKEAVSEGDLETAAVLLRVVSDRRLTHELVSQANELLGVTLDADDREVLVQLSGSPRTAEIARAVAPKAASANEPAPDNRINAVHAAANAAPRTSALDCLVAYKRAIETGRSDSAGIALAAAIRKAPDEPAVRQANALLGLEPNGVSIPEVTESGRSAAIPAEPAMLAPVTPAPAEPTPEPRAASGIPPLEPLLPSAFALAPAPAPLAPDITHLFSPAPMYEPAVQEAEAAMATAAPVPVPAPKP